MGPVTQEDPIGIAGGLNLYGYANGDPINYSDPFGLCVWDVCVAETAVVAGLFVGSAYLAAQISSRADEWGGALDSGLNAAGEFVGGIVNAVSTKVHERHLQGQVNNINTHFGKIGGPGGEDPNNRDKWKRDIQKGLREMRKRIDKLKGQKREEWEEVIRGIEDRLSGGR